MSSDQEFINQPKARIWSTLKIIRNEIATSIRCHIRELNDAHEYLLDPEVEKENFVTLGSDGAVSPAIFFGHMQCIPLSFSCLKSI